MTAIDEVVDIAKNSYSRSVYELAAVSLIIEAKKELESLRTSRRTVDKYKKALLDIIEECPNPKNGYGKTIVEIATLALEGN